MWFILLLLTWINVFLYLLFHVKVKFFFLSLVRCVQGYLFNLIPLPARVCSYPLIKLGNISQKGEKN
jgi:hypothetical protein